MFRFLLQCHHQAARKIRLKPVLYSFVRLDHGFAEEAETRSIQKEITPAKYFNVPNIVLTPQGMSHVKVFLSCAICILNERVNTIPR